MKQWRKAATLVGINLLLTLGLVEGVLRAFPNFIPANLLIKFEPRLRSKLAAGRFPTAEDATAFARTDGGPPFPIWKPFAQIDYSFSDPGTVNQVKMDELGFCNPPGRYEQHNQFDVIAIGDSFTWCTTVEPEATWPAQLAEITGFSTYNLGKPAIGLYEYLQLLERFGLPKSPKVVVMNIYEGNDLRDAVQYAEYQPPAGTTEAIAQPDKATVVDRYSYSWNLLKAVLTPAAATTQSVVAGRSAAEEDFRYDLVFKSGTVPFNLENGDLDEVVHAKLLEEGKIDLSVFTEALRRFKAMGEAHGFIPLVIYSPSAYTAYGEVVKFEQADLARMMPAYSQRQREFFAAQTAALGLRFIDLTPILAAKAPDYNTPEKLLYYQTNRHYTQYGHRVVAEAIAQAVKDAMAQPSQGIAPSQAQ